MNYELLKIIMTAYRSGEINKTEMAMAIGLWQLKTYGRIA